MSAQLASREGRSGDAETHLALAAELAKATGECNELNYHFGPANVTAWSVAIGVELQRGPEAVERVAADIPQLVAVLASAERRSGLHLDIARGWAQTGGDRDGEVRRRRRVRLPGARMVALAEKILARARRALRSPQLLFT
ncbi:MAG: hypothetical protein ACRDQ4_10750 [Pseudonocardiaceae bacterium]